MNGDSFTTAIAYVSLACLGVFFIWIFRSILQHDNTSSKKTGAGIDPAGTSDSPTSTPQPIAVPAPIQPQTNASIGALPLNGIKFLLLGCSLLGLAYVGFGSNAPSYSQTVNFDLMATRLFVLISSTASFIGAVIIASAQIIVREIRKAK